MHIGREQLCKIWLQVILQMNKRGKTQHMNLSKNKMCWLGYFAPALPSLSPSLADPSLSFSGSSLSTALLIAGATGSSRVVRQRLLPVLPLAHVSRTDSTATMLIVSSSVFHAVGADWAAGGCLLLCCAKHCGRHTTGLNRLSKWRILPMAGRPAEDSRATHFTSGSQADTSCDYGGLPLLICVSIFLYKKWK